MKIKAVLLTIVIIILSFGSVSCSNDRDYDEAEVISAAKELIKKAETVNEIYYGYGIRYDEFGMMGDNVYVEADLSSVNSFGIDTVSDIKALARECFTTDLSDIMISTVVSSVNDPDGNITSYARYIPKIDSSNDREIGILVNRNFKVLLTDKIEYDYDSVRVSGVDGETIFVKINLTVSTPEGKSQTKDIEIALLEQSDGFKLDSPTYARYVDENYYNDLQNKK